MTGDHDRSTDPTDRPSSTRDRRRTIAIAVAIVAAVTALGAIVGYVLSAAAGLEEQTILAITFTVSPGAFALYGAVTSATFLVTLLLVFRAVAMFDEVDDLEGSD